MLVHSKSATNLTKKQYLPLHLSVIPPPLTRSLPNALPDTGPRRRLVNDEVGDRDVDERQKVEANDDGHVHPSFVVRVGEEERLADRVLVVTRERIQPSLPSRIRYWQIERIGEINHLRPPHATCRKKNVDLIITYQLVGWSNIVWLYNLISLIC